MPRRRSPAHWYSVYMVAYANEGIKLRVERGEEDITQPGQLNVQNFYTGTSQAQAERSFSRAAIVAYNTPLAYAVAMQRDGQMIVRVKIEH